MLWRFEVITLFFVIAQHYDGDIRDLELTFSFDEDVLGKVSMICFVKPEPFSWKSLNFYWFWFNMRVWEGKIAMENNVQNSL